MKKLFFVIVLLLFGYFFGPSIVTFCLGKMVCHQCEKIFSVPFDYKKAEFKEGKWVLYGLTSQEDLLKIPRIEIDYHLHLKKHFVDFEILCSKPYVKIKKNNGFSNWNLEEKTLFKYPLTLKDGIVEFAFLENQKRLYFSLAQKKDRQEGLLSIWSDPKEKLEWKYYLKGKAILAEACFNNLSIKKFSFLEEKLLSQVEGITSGCISVFLDDAGPKITKLFLDVHHFAFEAPLMDWKLVGEKMHIENVHPFTLSAKNSLKLKASFDELSLKTSEKKELLEHIHGTFILDGIKADIQMNACAILDDKKEQLQIQASRDIDQKWKCIWAFPLSKVSFEYDYPKQLHLFLENVDPYHYTFYQNLLGNLTPLFKDFIWEKGILDAECIFHFRKDFLEKIEIPNVAFNHFQIYSLKHNCQLASSLMHIEKGLWDYNHLTNRQGKVSIQDGILNYDGQDFTHINTTLNLEKGYLKPSAFSCEIAHMGFEGNIEGTLEDFAIKGSLKTDLESMTSFLQVAKPQEKKALFISSYSLHKENQKLVIEGQAQIDKLKDPFEYSFQFKDFSLSNIFSTLEKGKISAKNISLDSYFHLFGYDVEGKVDIDANFSKDKCQVHFIGKDSLTFKNGLYELQIPDFAQHQAIFSVNSHEMKFHIKEFSGILTLFNYKKEIILEKAHLHYEKDQVICSFKKAHLPHAEFSGKAIYNFNQDKLVCFFPSLIGDAQEYFPFIPLYLSCQIPCAPTEGTLVGALEFTYEKRCLDLKAKLHLQNGKIPLKESLAFDKIEADIAIDTEKNIFAIENLKTNFLHNNKKLYTVQIPFIKKKETLPLYLFDMEIFKDKAVLAHFNGSLEKKEDFFIQLDPHLSHIFHSPINLLDFRMDSKGALKHLWCKPVLQKNFCFQFLKEINILTQDNFFQCDFDKDVLCEIEVNEKKDLFFHLATNHFYVENDDLGALDCILRKKNEKIILEKLLIQDYNISGLCQFLSPHIIQVKEGKCVQAKEMDFTFSSLVDLKKKSLALEIFDIHLNLPFKHNVEIYNLPIHGKLHGKGKSTICWSDEQKQFIHESKLQLSFEDISINAYQMKSLKPVHIAFGTNQNLFLEHLFLECMHPSFGDKPLKMEMEKLICDEEKKNFQIKDFSLNVPEKRIAKLLPPDLEMIQKIFRSNLPDSLQLKGSCEMSFKMDKISCEIPKIALVKGEILHNCLISYEDNYLYFDCSYKMNEKNYQLYSEVDLTKDLTGYLAVESDKNFSLSLDWNYQKEQGIIVRSLLGNIPGARFDFTLDEKRTTLDQMPLIGKALIDCKKLEENYPKLYKKIPLFANLAQHYELKGTLNLPKKNLQAFEFRGTLIGKKVSLKEMSFDTVVSRAILNKQGCLLTNLKMSGPEGLLAFNQMKYDFAHGDFMIDCLTCEDLKITLQQKTALCIREIKMPQIRGNIHDLQSITGKGEIELSHGLKKLNALSFDTNGINPQLFIPVKGKIAYQIEEGKIYFTGLENAYSAKEKSQLILSTKPKENYMDFEGNLQLHLALKEFGWFKDREKCNFSLQGSIHEPEFHIDKKKSFFSS
jgi:hypothetical protein